MHGRSRRQAHGSIGGRRCRPCRISRISRIRRGCEFGAWGLGSHLGLAVAGLVVVGPDQFLPMAEETGIINEMGASILRSPSAQLGQWRERVPADSLWPEITETAIMTDVEAACVRAV